jgi:SAM-dependent methyltransferase
VAEEITEGACEGIQFDPLDVDAYLFCQHFTGKVGAKVLVVGAHDEPSANLLAAAGMDVYGVDLREYDPHLPKCNYHYTRADFCDLPREYVAEHYGMFDYAVALSCIEHFGLDTYGEGGYQPYYDVLAMRQIYNMLKPGGTAYVTVPAGREFLEQTPHWRVYDYPSLLSRLVQDFTLERMVSMVATPIVVDGKPRKPRDVLTQREVATFAGFPPHISTLLVLHKNKAPRLAPDGR